MRDGDRKKGDEMWREKKDGREGEGFGTEEVMTREILRFRGRRRKIREWSL